MGVECVSGAWQGTGNGLQHECPGQDSGQDHSSPTVPVNSAGAGIWTAPGAMAYMGPVCTFVFLKQHVPELAQVHGKLVEPRQEHAAEQTQTL